MKSIAIVDPDASKLDEFEDKGVEALTKCPHVDADDVLMLAMPPQAFEASVQSMPHLRGHAGTVISVMAGSRRRSFRTCWVWTRSSAAFPTLLPKCSRE